MATVCKSKVNFRKLDLVANLRRENDELEKEVDRLGEELKKTNDDWQELTHKLYMCKRALCAALECTNPCAAHMAAVSQLLSR